jgi:hypothetical protein
MVVKPCRPRRTPSTLDLTNRSGNTASRRRSADAPCTWVSPSPGTPLPANLLIQPRRPPRRRKALAHADSVVAPTAFAIYQSSAVMRTHASPKTLFPGSFDLAVTSGVVHSVGSRTSVYLTRRRGIVSPQPSQSMAVYRLSPRVQGALRRFNRTRFAPPRGKLSAVNLTRQGADGTIRSV